MGRRSAGLLLFWLAIPTLALAQGQASGIAGVVRDNTGGVLPGVTVEASSPVLIEGVRTGFTDGEGRYNIIDLRPGTYSVTFSLPGFSTVIREGITLTSGFTANITVQLQIGGIEETITVTGASPLVDVQNVRRQSVVSSELLDALPTSQKAVGTLINLTPGLFGVQDVGGTLGAYRAQGTPQSLEYHGRQGMKLSYDGMQVLNMVGEGNTGYIVNALLVEEMVLESGGLSAESAASGFAANNIPKEGGNDFSFQFSGMISTGGMQSSNLNDDLRARGLESTNEVDYIRDAGFTVGGPIKRDKLWFFSAVREQGIRNFVAGIFYNATQGTPFYTPDLDRPSDRFEYYRSYATRFTWQASQNNKLNFMIDAQNNCGCRREGFATPESKKQLRFSPQGIYQASWTSPVTNRLLIEAGAGVTVSHWPTWPQSDVTPGTRSFLERSQGLLYNADDDYDNPTDSDRYAQRASLSYVTGTHNFKTGIQLEQGISNIGRSMNAGSTYTRYELRNGVPNRVMLTSEPYLQKDRMLDIGIYAQDQWRLDRMTVNYGVRFDYFRGWVPAQRADPTLYIPFERVFDRVDDVPNFKDINPRVGVSYDLFGTGQTALKWSLGRYVSKESISFTQQNNPFTTSVNSVFRTWNDLDGDFETDCDMVNPLANGECGQLTNLNFGQQNISTRFDEEVRKGFGVRQANWDMAAEIQHELRPGMSLTGGYYFTTGSNFRVTDNLEVGPDDFDPYCIDAPADSRLPGGGGYEVCGLADISVEKFGLSDNLVRPASDFGDQIYDTHFFSLSLDTRFDSGAQLGGGIDTGKIIDDHCFVVDSPQDLLNCRVERPFSARTQLKLHGSYPLPGDAAVSFVYQNSAGVPYEADYVASNAEIAPSLGRNLSRGANGTAVVPLIAPWTEFEARLTQLDLRFTKFINVDRVRVQFNFDLYNVLNSNSLIGVQNTFGPSWRWPLQSTATGVGILDGRLMQFSGRVSY